MKDALPIVILMTITVVMAGGFGVMAVRHLKDWEWTWTRAAVFCLLLGFFILITQAVIPSYLLYYFDVTGCPFPGLLHGACKLMLWDDNKLNKYIAEATVMGWITVTFGGMLVTAVVLQNKRRKLLGHDHATSGQRSAS
jgi:hypothetical protein